MPRYATSSRSMATAMLRTTTIATARWGSGCFNSALGFVKEIWTTPADSDWMKLNLRGVQNKDAGLPMDRARGLGTKIEHAHDAFWRNVETGIQNVLQKEAKTGQASYYRQGRWII